MKYVRIKVMSNGYLVGEDASREDPLGYCTADPYVFETFYKMIDWLRTNLDKPEKGDPAFNP